MSKFEQIDSVIKLLITPAAKSAQESQTGAYSVNDLLKSSLQSALDQLDSDASLLWLNKSTNKFVLEGPTEDICWQFTKFSLQLLLSLSELLKVARKEYNNEFRVGQPGPLPADTLSIQQQKNITSVLQFIACIGISKNLLPGVGTPIQQRSKFGAALVNVCEQGLSDFDKHQILFSTIYALNECSEHPTLSSLIFTRHLGDVLAALMQLTFAPLKKLESLANADSPLKEQLKAMLQTRMVAGQLLNKLVEKTYQPIVVRELLLLHKSVCGGTSKVETGSYKSVKWLTQAAQKLLSDILVRENGVQALIRGILDFPADNSTGTPNDWANCDVVARLISSCITQASDKEAYAKLICPQILNILDTREELVIPQFVRVASLTVMAVALAEPKLAQCFLIEPIVTPLLILCHYQKNIHCKPSEEELSASISKVLKVFVSNPDPNEKFAEFLSPVIGIIMDMFAFLNTGASYMRKLLQDILIYFFKFSNTSTALNAMKRFIFAFDDVEALHQHLNPCLVLIHGSNGGIAVANREYLESDELSWIDADQSKVAAILSLLSQFQKDRYVVDFFLAVLQNLTLIIHEDEPILTTSDTCCKQSDELLRIEQVNNEKQSRIRKSLLIVQTLSALCQQPALQESILQDKSKVIQFLKVTLERGSNCCESNDTKLGSETLTLAMTILSMMITGEENEQEIQSDLKSCLTSLHILAKKYPDETIRSLAEELAIAICTHGIISVPIKSDGASSSANNQNNSAYSDTKTSAYQQARKDLLEDEPASRGHALLVILKLIQSRDEETIANKVQLIEVLHDNLNHEDSYVYLMAVRAFEVLATAFPDIVLPYLIDQYSSVETAISFELRIKFGEVLLKVTRTLGDVIPKYREPLLNAFLSTTKHDDPHIRASCLSNLGEVCKGLRYSMGGCTHQIINCLTNFIKHDSSLEVRRAAVQVFSLMLRGMGKDSFKILENQMKDIYRLLKFVYQTDKDDVVKLHAQLALEELDIICREFLFPKTVLEKKITVLS